MSADVVIRPATDADADAIARIYNHYVANTIITFEEQPVPSAEVANRIAANAANALPWLIATQGDRVVGYTHASKWKGRCAYRFSVESTAYLAPGSVGRGIGSRLYELLLDRLREKSVHVVLAGIALPNPASVALHEKLGFRKVGHFGQVGFKFNQWIDVGYWQLSL
ncbi:MAG TPA: arsinothricin resistance N-acetyltransferase ArsN1 family B [Gammaproteobacteria bacterium]|nr:arsinothricin resistance N-acetyltransferase ArsN1 family B [Gammaproteobacteria bacterium]